MDLFKSMTNGKNVRDKKGVSIIFGKMLRRSRLNRHELHAIMTAFK